MFKSTLVQSSISYLTIFSELMKKPYLLSGAGSCSLTINDFPEKFHKIVFSAIYNLHKAGAQQINKLEILSLLENYPEQKSVFLEQQGETYLDHLENFITDESDSNASNFAYHYEKVKKYTMLRLYQQSGIDIRDFFNPDLLSLEEEEALAKKFDEATTESIQKHFEAKLLSVVEEAGISNGENISAQMGENAQEIIEKKMRGEAFGDNFQSGYFNTATRGARIKKLFCISGNSGSGKTRSSLANLLNMTVTHIFNLQKNQWEATNNTSRGVFISTELEEDEIVIPALCFISGVEEDKFLDGKLTIEEQDRITYAKNVLLNSPVWLEIMFDFDIDDIEKTILKYVYKCNITHCVFDYMHTTEKIFESLGKKNMRNLQEHQVLRMMSIRLKTTCNANGVWIGTATQLNDSWKEGVLDQSALEGSKSIVNKLDIGAIQVPLSIKDETVDAAIRAENNIGFLPMATHTINIYKNRGNKWNLIRIWVNFNLGNLRMTDCYVTNYKGELLEDIEPTMISKILTEEEMSKREQELMAVCELSEFDLKDFMKTLEFESNEHITDYS